MKKLFTAAAIALTAMFTFTGCGSTEPIVGDWEIIGALDESGNRVVYEKSDLDSSYHAKFDADNVCTIDIDGNETAGTWDVDSASGNGESKYNVVVDNVSMDFYIKNSEKKELYGKSGDKTLIFGKK